MYDCGCAQACQEKALALRRSVLHPLSLRVNEAAKAALQVGNGFAHHAYCTHVHDRFALPTQHGLNPMLHMPPTVTLNTTQSQTSLAAGDLKGACAHAAAGVAFARAAYAHVPNHPHVGLQRYTLGQLLCEVATTASELRLGCAELDAAAQALQVACGEESELASGAADLLMHHKNRLPETMGVKCST